MGSGGHVLASRGWWWAVVDMLWLVVSSGGSWRVMVGGGIV